MDSTAAVEGSVGAPRRTFPWKRMIGGIVLLVLLILVGRRIGGALPAAAEAIRGLGIWGGVAFVGLYGAAAVAFVPGSLLTLAAGALFGIGWGVVWVLLGATVGASLAFLVARYLARSWVEARIGANPRFAAVDRAIGRDGRRIVFLLRLSPVFPFNALNYALGLTKVRFVDYLVACVGMLPGSLLYVYYGKLAGDVATLAGGAASTPRGLGYWAVLILGLAATLAVTMVVTRAARRALAEATEEEGEDEGGEVPAAAAVGPGDRGVSGG